MKPKALFLACLLILGTPRLLLACGGCTDAVLRMTMPWTGFGILLLWLWIITMVVVRSPSRRSDEPNATPLVRGSTLVVFAVLGSVGYIVLVFLTVGSLMLPSLFIGFLWAVYVVLRTVADVPRFAAEREPAVRTRLVMHSVFLVFAVALIAYFQTATKTLGHCVACLRYGHHVALFSTIMPRIVGNGQKAVEPLIAATNEALGSSDEFRRLYTIGNASFCLGRIGGPEAEDFLSGLLKRQAIPDNYCDIRWYKQACFAYARCAGPRAVDDIVALFEKSPHTTEKDDRAFFLVALAITGSRRGVAFALDHMDLLLQQMENSSDGSDISRIQATAQALVFGKDAHDLMDVPVYRDGLLVGNVSVVDPRPNDYASEFYWTESSRSGLRTPAEIEAAWKKDPAAIKKRWADLLQ